MSEVEFTTSQVTMLTGVNRKTLHYWAKTGFVVPSIAKAKGTGTRNRYAFQDVVAVRIVRELREKGISLQAVRRVVHFLRQSKGTETPLAETYLASDGNDVYIKNGSGLMSVLRQPGQQFLSFVVVNLSRTIAELRRASADLAHT